jgi:hypothetical protein
MNHALAFICRSTFLHSISVPPEKVSRLAGGRVHTSFYEVVDNEDVIALNVALLDLHDALIAIPDLEETD